MRLVIAVLLCLLPSIASAGIFGEDVQCVVGGCSGQLCVDARQEPIASTCEWTEAYGCYHKFGECKEQDDGKCGWTPTEDLLHCLTYPKREPMPYPDYEEMKENEFNHRKPEQNP